MLNYITFVTTFTYHWLVLLRGELACIQCSNDKMYFFYKKGKMDTNKKKKRECIYNNDPMRFLLRRRNALTIFLLGLLFSLSVWNMYAYEFACWHVIVQKRFFLKECFSPLFSLFLCIHQEKWYSAEPHRIIEHIQYILLLEWNSLIC